MNGFKRDDKGRFVKGINWRPLKAALFVLALAFVWIGSIWVTVELVSDSETACPIKIVAEGNGTEPLIIIDSAYRSGLTKGSDDTIRIFSDLTALGLPWDYEEIKRRLVKKNPELK